MKLLKKMLLCLLAVLVITSSSQGKNIASAAPYSAQNIDEILDMLSDVSDEGAAQEGVNNIDVVGIIMTQNPVMVPPAIDVIKEGDKVISGTGDPGNKLYVTLPNGTVLETIVDKNGKWSIELPSDVTLSAGDTVTAVQENSGKQSEPATAEVKIPKETFTKTPSAENVALGDSVNYTLKGIGNPADEVVYQYSVADIPPKELTLISGKLPAFTKGEGIKYKIIYSTNLSKDNVLYEGLSAATPYDFIMKSLNAGEYMTSVVVIFDEVPVDFAKGNEIVYNFRVDESAENGKIINKGHISYDLVRGGQTQREELWNNGDSGIQVGSGNNKKAPRTGDPFVGTSALTLSCSLLFVLLFKLKRKKDEALEEIV